MSALFSVTINDTIQWTPIPGAHFEVIVLNSNPGSALDPPGVVGTGAINEVAVSVLLTGKPLGIYFIRARSMNPDGTGKSPWSDAANGEFQLVAFGVPGGFNKKP